MRQRLLPESTQRPRQTRALSMRYVRPRRRESRRSLPGRHVPHGFTLRQHGYRASVCDVPRRLGRRGGRPMRRAHEKLRARALLRRSVAPLRSAGEACGSEWATGCKPPLYCTGAPGVCRLPGNLGDSCDPTSMCASGLVCDTDKKVCSEITWAGPGEQCDGWLTLCRRGNCPHATPFDSHICPVVVAEGEACGTAGRDCDEGSVCFGGKCIATNAVDCH